MFERFSSCRQRLLVPCLAATLALIATGCEGGSGAEGAGSESGNAYDASLADNAAEVVEPPGVVCVSTPEICDGLDNDCNGDVDDGDLCGDGDACNGAEQCTAGQCQAGSAPQCDDGESCTIDGCDAATGCTHEAQTAVTCDDGDACTGCSLPANLQAVYAAKVAGNCPEEKWVGCNALWLPGFFDGNEKHVVRFDIDAAARFEWFADGSAHLHGVVWPYELGGAKNGTKGEKYDLSIWFQYRGQGAAGEGTGGPKLDDGWVVPKNVTNTWHYFDMVPGQATIAKQGSTEVTTLTQKPKGSVFPFQIGLGANGKTMAFGSSAWFDYVRTFDGGVISGHGDVNVDLDALPIPADCDTCSAGKCTAGPGQTCDDGNPCTDDSCDATTGDCSHVVLDGKACDDGVACTEGDACHNGHCKHGAPNHGLCADGDPCTKDHCTLGIGCQNEGADPKTPCDDGDACTAGEACQGKKCKGGEPVDCDDGNPCTQDICYPAKGCVSKPMADGSCDDGDACTKGDSCVAGECQAGSAVSCDDGNPCSKDSCHPTQGCINEGLDGDACDDGNACTGGDACTSGKCKPGALVDCADGNPCTANACDWEKGCLVKNLDGDACSDGSACTQGDACQGGECQAGATVKCDDGNPCTKDSCFAALGCVNEGLDGDGCSDGTVCTQDDKCVGGKCVAGPALPCDDGNPCTADGCDAETGCKHKALSGNACSDGDACTANDACVGGTCSSGTPVACDDGDACTSDGCDSKAGCVTKPLTGTPCDDGDACTQGDHCVSGKCACGGAIQCNDGNVCTIDGCDPKTGCVTKDHDGAKCSDGDVCTTGDACKGGKCVGKAPLDCQDGNPCTIDSCDASGCTHKADDGAKCSDGNACTVGDACAGGKCAAGQADSCDDGNACTADGCDPKAGCWHKYADGKACDDGDACTAADACAGGKCAGGAAKCDDGNPCTKDGCDAATGCTHGNADGALCNDGNVCTQADVCDGGKCHGKLPKGCSDGNPCTADSCDPKLGCLHAPADGLPCDDGNVCTKGDVCAAGKCACGKMDACDDGNPCTADGCDAKSGCWHKDLDSGKCDDGDVCTGADTCQGGACVGGGGPDCDDGNPCTADGCAAGVGCTHEAVSSGQGSLSLVSDAQTLANGQPGVPTWDQHKSWTASIPGATWIWSEKLVSDPIGDTVVDFSRTFTVPAGAAGIQATLVVAADNSYACTLNGQPAGADATEFNYFESGKDTWQVGGLVQPGSNVLACKVKNWAMWWGTPYSNPAGLLYKLNLAWTVQVGCDDGNACTSGDICQAGKCAGPVAKTCSDGNGCTADSCDPASGNCVFAPQTGGACDDGNACTGSCQPAGVDKQYVVSKANAQAPVCQYGAGHALSLPNFDGNGQSVRMVFDADARFQHLSGGKAHLWGTATVYAGGAIGQKWSVDVWLKYRGQGAAGQGAGGPKKELKAGYQPKSLTDTWQYYDIIPGQATIKHASGAYATLTQAPANSMYPFQVGKGANGKNLHYGASSWFYFTRHQGGKAWSGQGDFNLDFTFIDPTTGCDSCQAGKCSGAKLDCDDGDPSTADSCGAGGKCVHTKLW